MNKFKEIPASKTSLTLRKPLYSIGINDSTYNTTYMVENKSIVCPYYAKWRQMLERCYSSNFHSKKPTYSDCTVCETWLTFSNFKAWMSLQNWENKYLDKDILVEGNKVYSPETCVFVSMKVNNMLLSHISTRGKYKLGVSWFKRDSLYRSSCNNGEGKTVNLGHFKTEDEAHIAYCKYKTELILNEAKTESDLRLKNALINRANTIHLTK